MIILPTEKRIDWKRPPFVLLSIVALNILIFLFYQADDDELYFEAFEQYQKHEFIKFEADAYLYYLRHKGFDQKDPVLYREYQDALNDDPEMLIQPILMDREFYTFLQENPEWISTHKREVWEIARPLVEKKITSTSWLALGLIPQQQNLVTLITHQFLHGGFMHLLGNMVFLLICGFAVEAALGHFRFLVFYLLGGMAGGLLFSAVELWTGGGGRPLVGASGAISGVMAMYLVLFRLKKIEFFYWVLFLVGYFRAPALVILPLYIGNELYSFIREDQSAVAYMAHAGGFLGGALLVGLALWRKPEAIDQDYLDEDQAADAYQEGLDKLYRLLGDFQFLSALKHVEGMIQEHGANHELMQVRFNVLRIDGGEPWFACGQEILRQRGFNHALIRSQLNVWRQSEAPMRDGLNDDDKLQLAIRFMELDAGEAAEGIATELIEKGYKDIMMVKLTGLLAKFYGQQNHGSKRSYFERVMQEIQEGAQA